MVVVATREHTDEVLSMMEQTLRKVHTMKLAGRRASLAGAEVDLMKLVAETRDIMQTTLQKAKHHHELLVEIFGGDFVRISRSRAILDHIFFSDAFSAGKQVDEGLQECQAVEDVLRDLGYNVVLQQVQAQELMAFLERVGNASEEEKAAARAKMEAASAAAQKAAAGTEQEAGDKKQEAAPVKVEAASAAAQKAAPVKEEAASAAAQKAAVGQEQEGAAKEREEAPVKVEAVSAAAEREEVEVLQEEEAPKVQESKTDKTEEGAAAAAVAAAAEEEQRCKAEEALQMLEQAKQAKRRLPSLKAEEALDLQEVEKRGAVEVVKAQEAAQDQPPPEPAPGVRFIVLGHPSLVGQHGTLLQPARGVERWAVRMDSGSSVELEASQFGLAPAPLAQVSFKEPIDFKRVHHGDPPIATYTDEAGTMRLLKDAASVLKAYSSAVVSIEGHTATPDSKMDEWAQELAQGRADKIKDAFVSLGIDQERLKPIGLPGKLGGMNHDVVLKLVSF